MQQPPAAQSSPPCHDVAANQRVKETNTQGDHMDASESNTNTEHPLWSQIVQQDFPYHDVVAEHPEHPSSSTQCHAVTAGNTTSVVDQKGPSAGRSLPTTSVTNDSGFQPLIGRNSSTASHWSQEKSIVGKGWTVPSYTKQKFHDGIVDDARALFDVTLQSVEVGFETEEARRRGNGDNEDDDDGDWRCEDGAQGRPRRTSTLHCPPPGS